MAAFRATVMCAACSAAFAYVIPSVTPTQSSSMRSASTAIQMETGIEKMDLMMPKQKTWMPKAADTSLAAKKWVVIDATGLRLGRMASEIAKLLLGKHKTTFTPGADIGDYVIVINAEKIMVTGKKASQKLYRRHSGRPGGMKVEAYEDLIERIPERIVEKAVAGMLPKNSHGRELFRHLKVYKGSEHPHESQQPEALTFGTEGRRGRIAAPDSQVLEFEDPDAILCAN